MGHPPGRRARLHLPPTTIWQPCLIAQFTQLTQLAQFTQFAREPSVLGGW